MTAELLKLTLNQNNVVYERDIKSNILRDVLVDDIQDFCNSLPSRILGTLINKLVSTREFR